MKSILNDTPFQQFFGYQEEVNRLSENKLIKNKVVLDIGCGFGWWDQICIKKKVKKIVGLDISEESLNITKKIKSKKLKVKLGSALKLPFNNNSFDTVGTWEVLEHIPSGTENIMFQEINRVLKPGGYMLLSTQYQNFFSVILDPAWWLIGHRHYSKKQLITLINSNCNFEIEKIYIKGGFFTLMNSINIYVAKWIFRRFPFFQNFFINKTKEEYEKNNGLMNIFLKCRKIIN